MFTGVGQKRAIKAWMAGKDVRVLDRNAEDPAGNIALIPLDNLLKGYEFLVDVPAVEDPEFKGAVEGMISGQETEREQERRW